MCDFRNADFDRYRLALGNVNCNNLLDSRIDVDHMCTLFTHSLRVKGDATPQHKAIQTSAFIRERQLSLAGSRTGNCQLLIVSESCQLPLKRPNQIQMDDKSDTNINITSNITYLNG